MELDIIGRCEHVNLPELHLENIEAKIDTGAYSSSIHCHEIRIDEKENERWVAFKILDPEHPNYQNMEYYLPVFKKKKVKNSFGTSEERVFIKTPIQIFGQIFDIELSLTDRSEMKYPVLIGRKALKERFIVDASQNNLADQIIEKRPLKIAILSRKESLYSTSRLVEAGEARGHEISIINYLHSYITINKGKPNLHYKNDSLADIDAIIPRIGASHTFFGAAAIRQFEMMNIFTVNPSQAIVRSRDKLRSHQVLSGAGIDMPSTGFVRTIDEVDTVIDEVGGYPIILKLLEGTHGSGVVLVENRQQARSTLDAFHSLKTNILIQEFIKEAKGEDIRAFVVAGKVVGAMKRTAAKGDFRSNLHKGGSSVLVKLSKVERAVAVKAAKALGLNVAGVDLIRSERGPLVLEVNSSPGLEGIEKATRQDIATSIIKFIENSAFVGTGKKQRDKVGA